MGWVRGYDSEKKKSRVMEGLGGGNGDWWCRWMGGAVVLRGLSVLGTACVWVSGEGSTLLAGVLLAAGRVSGWRLRCWLLDIFIHVNVH